MTTPARPRSEPHTAPSYTVPVYTAPSVERPEYLRLMPDSPQEHSYSLGAIPGLIDTINYTDDSRTYLRHKLSEKN